MNGSLKFLTARKILPLLDLLAKFKRVLACSCSPNFCVARKLAKQIFYFCSCSQKSRSARHARECSQRPLVTPIIRRIKRYSSSRRLKCQHLRRNWFWREWSRSRREHRLTFYLDDFFLQKQQYTKNVPAIA